MSESDTNTDIIKLPYWSGEVRCIPSLLLRSALFTAKQPRHSNPEWVDEKDIACLKGSNIKYTGYVM